MSCSLSISFQTGSLWRRKHYRKWREQKWNEMKKSSLFLTTCFLSEIDIVERIRTLLHILLMTSLLLFWCSIEDEKNLHLISKTSFRPLVVFRETIHSLFASSSRTCDSQSFSCSSSNLQFHVSLVFFLLSLLILPSSHLSSCSHLCFLHYRLSRQEEE